MHGYFVGSGHIPAPIQFRSPRFFGTCKLGSQQPLRPTPSMAEPDAKATQAGGASTGPVKPERPPNPVWRMMGACYVVAHATTF